jgi:hypothetical protein
MAVDTTQVADRRSVHYDSLDEFLADAERLSRIPTKTVGNWTLAQIFDHLTRSMNTAVDGSAAVFPAPLRFFLRFVRKRIASSPMKPGFHLPKKVDAVLMPGRELETGPALEKLRESVSRFCNAATFHPHLAFGKLSREEWTSLMLRHSELHMSFVVPLEVDGVVR